MSTSPFHVWAILCLLPNMQRTVVNRFRRRSDAEECLRVLRRASPKSDYTLLYYPPSEELEHMLRKEYNKLIRDRIPEILEDQDVQFAVEEMPQAEYCQALRQKLIEEAHEAAAASEHELINELADIWEVIDAIMNAYKINRNQVLACQMQKQIERGVFTRKLRLLWTQV